MRGGGDARRGWFQQTRDRSRREQGIRLHGTDGGACPLRDLASEPVLASLVRRSDGLEDCKCCGRRAIVIAKERLDIVFFLGVEEYEISIIDLVSSERF